MENNIDIGCQNDNQSSKSENLETREQITIDGNEQPTIYISPKILRSPWFYSAAVLFVILTLSYSINGAKTPLIIGEILALNLITIIIGIFLSLKQHKRKILAFFAYLFFTILIWFFAAMVGIIINRIIK